MNERKTIDIALEGDYEGEPISPYVVDIAYLRSLLEDVEKLISIESKRKREKISLQLEKGSLWMRIEAPTYQINSLKADLDELEKSHSLAALHPRRSGVLRKWHEQAREDLISFKFGLNGVDWGFKLSKDTEFKAPEETWFETELYLFGEVTDIGGKTNPNFHIETKEYGRVKVQIPKDVLRDDDKGRTYKFFLVRVSCMQEINSGIIDHVSFIDWVDYYPEYDEEKLEHSIEVGKEGWKGISDSAEYIRKQRGYDD